MAAYPKGRVLIRHIKGEENSTYFASDFRCVSSKNRQFAVAEWFNYKASGQAGRLGRATLLLRGGTMSGHRRGYSRLTYMPGLAPR